MYWVWPVGLSIIYIWQKISFFSTRRAENAFVARASPQTSWRSRTPPSQHPSPDPTVTSTVVTPVLGFAPYPLHIMSGYTSAAWVWNQTVTFWCLYIVFVRDCVACSGGKGRRNGKKYQTLMKFWWGINDFSSSYLCLETDLLCMYCAALVA